MRQTSALVLLSTFAGQGLVAAGSLPRGVGPEFAKFYQTKDTFTCIGHPSISLRSSQVNDDTCDCPDGSDEPGTAACSYLDPLSPAQPLAGSTTGTTNTTLVLPGFWCENRGHIGAYLPFMYVNDGVCDYDLCCEGTEEYSQVGGLKCPNKCAEIGKEHRHIKEQRKKAKELAEKKRRTISKESKELRRQVEARVAKLTEEIRELEVRRDELKQKYDEVERSERGKVVKGGEGGEGGGGKLGVLAGLAKARVNELRDALGRVVDQRDNLQDKVDELEGILRKFNEEYNPNFNDEGVKAAVRSWQDYAAKIGADTESYMPDADELEVLKEDGENNGVNWSEFDEDDTVSDTDVLYSFEAYLPGPLREYVHSKLALLRVWMIENGILADSPTSSGESRLVAAAREAYQAVEGDMSGKQRSLDSEKADLEKDYGADDIFRFLKDKCVSTDVGEYTYELCWLARTNQKSKRGGATTNMGNFDRIDVEMADDEERVDGKGLGRGPRMVLRYENGQGCWNGPSRRTNVWLGCAETEEIWRVSESEKCVYRMEVGTPAACEHVGEPGLRTKDEL